MSTDTPKNWTSEQNALFRRLHQLMTESQSVFMHPEAARLSDEHWSTVALNAAWTAAEMTGSDDKIVFRDGETGEVLASEHDGELQ
jgi:hypothetical protein